MLIKSNFRSKLIKAMVKQKTTAANYLINKYSRYIFSNNFKAKDLNSNMPQ